MPPKIPKTSKRTAPKTSSIVRISLAKKQLQRNYRPVAVVTTIPTTEAGLQQLLQEQFAIKFQLRRELNRVSLLLSFKYGVSLKRNDATWQQIYKIEAMKQIYDENLVIVDKNIQHLQHYCLERDYPCKEQVILNVQK